MIKNLSLIRTFVYAIAKFSIWLGIPSKYTEDFYVIVSVIVVDIFSERLTDTYRQDFSLLLLAL